MYKVTIHGLAEATTPEAIGRYFAFCGKVSSVELAPGVDESNHKTATVVFERPAAVKTALLLTDSELDGARVRIEASSDVLAAVEKAGDEAEPPTGGTNDPDHISQEFKPRSAILAEYLSHGYILGDKVVARGLEVDRKHGIYDRFSKYLQDLDAKYRIRERSEATDSKYGISSAVVTNSERAYRYLESVVGATEQRTGWKIRDFYKDVVSEANEVHQEARRLADLKKQQQQEAAAPATEESK